MRAILTFHSVDARESVLSCSPRYLAALLEALAERAIPVLDLGTLLAPETASGIAITFDDGMRSVLDNALPVLRAHGAPAHMFIATSAIGTAGGWPRDDAGIGPYDMLDWDGVAALQDAGVLIEAHTHSHPDLRTLDTARMVEECARADELIERRCGRHPEFFAYPFGYHNTAVRAMARARYRAAVTTELRPLGAAEDPAALPRLDSYYLRSEWRMRHLDSAPMRAWLGLRNRLRNLKGSQCPADCR